MGMSRRDLYGECNVDGAPVDVFTAECCVRCLNPECSRSSRGGKFELRVATWEERLFENPPQMLPDDPRYRSIAGQRFLAIDTGRIPEVRGSAGWVDPLAEGKREEFMKLAADAGPLPTSALASGEPPQPPEASKPKVLPRHLVLANAPDQTGKTVGPAPPPKRDPWAPPPSPGSSGTIISPGATVKFGGGGV